MPSLRPTSRGLEVSRPLAVGEGPAVPGIFRWKVTKDGCTPVEGFRDPVEERIQFTLDPEGRLPPGMVRVSGNAYREKSDDPNDPHALDLEDYWIDRCEVTNRQFKEFMDQGGYRERKYWKHFHDPQMAPVVFYASTASLLESPLGQGVWLTAGALVPGKTEQMVLSWEDAMKKFHDETGKPGPSTWRFGTYPVGRTTTPSGESTGMRPPPTPNSPARACRRWPTGFERVACNTRETSRR